MNRTTMIVAALAAAGTAAPAIAGEGHFDAYVTFENGQIRTGTIDLDEAPPVVTPNVRVFPGDLGEAPNPPGFGDAPGFYTDALTPGTSVGFNITDALRIWDGSDFDQYAGAGEYLELSKGVEVRQTPATPGGFVAGPIIATADGAGMFDDHPDYELVPNGLTAVVLLELELWTDAPGVANSERLWLVLNNGADEATHDAAIAWAEANIPAPGVAAPLALAGAMAMRRRR